MDTITKDHGSYVWMGKKLRYTHEGRIFDINTYDTEFGKYLDGGDLMRALGRPNASHSLAAAIRRIETTKCNSVISRRLPRNSSDTKMVSFEFSAQISKFYLNRNFLLWITAIAPAFYEENVSQSEKLKSEPTPIQHNSMVKSLNVSMELCVPMDKAQRILAIVNE